ncbi:hypothetical protein BH24ACT19_BH24ACT19_00090 [soil metagenome]
MMNRGKVNFWTRVGALALAVIFVISFGLVGIGANADINLLGLFGGSQEQEQAQTSDPQEQISQAEQELEEDPENPRLIRRLAGLYLQNGQTDRAVEVLENGREAAPDDPVIALYLGQAYQEKAQGLTDEEERTATYEQAGDAYAAAAELQSDRPQPYLLAGQAYDQAGEKGKAIEYWNDYLELEPEGEEADAVKERIASLLEGGDTTSDAEGAPK